MSDMRPCQSRKCTDENSGFVEEGRLRKALWKGGKFVDIILMAILDDEWCGNGNVTLD